MSASAPKRILRRFCRNDRGSAAVEFSLIAVPFFALLFAIIETGLVFFADQVLETGIHDSSRFIYTNQMTQQNTNAVQFKQDLCPRIQILMNCDNVDIDVKYYPPGTAITIVDPISGTGSYDNSGFTFNLPPSGATGTVVVRGFYRWPLIVTGLGYNIANIDRGTGNRRLLAATAAFHIEPPP